jgi:radical SAM protein with 4Fe4S-binding SPASM domain
MSSNLDQLLPVTRFAAEVGAAEVFIHPVIGRHPVPYDFSRELDSNKLTAQFKESLRGAISETRAACPTLQITVLNPDLDLNPVLHTAPSYFAPSLPGGGRIHSCDQSPFESVHVLANGDVVVCEVHDEIALGNLHERKLRDIWRGDRYRRFREQYVTGANPACRDCVWKTAYQVEPWKSQIRASEGFNPQLTRGWWIEANAAAIWSKKQSVAELKGSVPARRVRVEGILPHDPVGHSNELRISADGRILDSITNETGEFLHFVRNLPLRVPARQRVTLGFATTHTFRPSAHSNSPDCRDLGFALQRLELQ